MFIHRHKHRHRRLDDKKEITSLIDIKDGKKGIIVSIQGGKTLTKRLADLGLTSGTEIKVIGRTLFSGPVQIEVCGSRLALGRGLASKISVELK